MSHCLVPETGIEWTFVRAGGLERVVAVCSGGVVSKEGVGRQAGSTATSWEGRERVMSHMIVKVSGRVSSW